MSLLQSDPTTFMGCVLAEDTHIERQPEVKQNVPKIDWGVREPTINVLTLLHKN